MAAWVACLALGWLLGTAGTAWVVGVYDRHTNYVVRVCPEQEQSGTTYQRRLYATSGDTVGTLRTTRYRDAAPQ